MAARSLLVFGATGRAGSCVVDAALATGGWRVTAFVRNPAKIPPATAANPLLTVVRGDLTDAAAISAVVSSSRADAIIDASSALPGGKTPNTANRSLMYRAVVAALEADGRVGDCYLLSIGGQLFPEPGGTINSWTVSSLAAVLSCLMPRLWREAAECVSYMFLDSPPQLRFTMARLGYMVEAPSRGVLVAEPTENNIQRGSVSYVDVGRALVGIAGDADAVARWSRKALFLNYAQ